MNCCDGVPPGYQLCLRVDQGQARWLSAITEAEGRSLPVIDGLLAATALHHNLMLVTRDDSDLAGRAIAPCRSIAWPNGRILIGGTDATKIGAQVAIGTRTPIRSAVGSQGLSVSY